MQDLTGKFPAGLAPTSQEGGNMVQLSLPKAGMTAPGSEPVTPLPESVQGVHVPEPTEGPASPVSNAPHKPQPVKSPAGGGHWGNAKFPGSPWKETS